MNKNEEGAKELLNELKSEMRVVQKIYNKTH